ncbi:hypothetical protein V2J09_004507 [Rumex salicifolius]
MLKRRSSDLVNPSDMKQKENSVSSPDSDSRSYSYVSVEDDEISKGDDAALSWRTGGRDKIHHISGIWDPLVDCVQTLQSTQEALEQELQKFGELGRELQHLDDESNRTSFSVDPEFCVVSTSESPTSDFGTEIPDVLISLTKNIEIFEKQIQGTKGMLREKETKIAQLQATVNKLSSSNEDLQRSIDLQEKLYEEIEAEVGTLYKEKMEAEILYLAIADMNIVTENRMKLLVTKQKSLVNAQAQELQKVANLERRAANLKDTAEGMQNGIISKFSFYFIIQLLLFLFMFEMFKSQFLSKTTVILPT